MTDPRSDSELAQLSCALRVMAMLRSPGAADALREIEAEIENRRPRDRWSMLLERARR